MAEDKDTKETLIDRLEKKKIRCEKKIAAIKDAYQFDMAKAEAALEEVNVQLKALKKK